MSSQTSKSNASNLAKIKQSGSLRGQSFQTINTNQQQTKPDHTLECASKKRSILNAQEVPVPPTSISKHHCEHLEKLKRSGGVKTYTKICIHLIFGLSKETKNLRKVLAKCNQCGRCDGFLSTCAHCIFFACVRRGHFNNHSKETGHVLGCDLRTGSLYCYKCCDVVYDHEFDAILKFWQARSDWTMMLPSEAGFNGMNNIQKNYTTHGVNGKPVCVAPRTTIGLRGLINLGHTCFMNCIVQAMIHTPLLRNFFLTDRINCNEKHDKEGKKPCIVTLVCDLYQEFHSGAKDPMSLHGLLHKIWGNAAHLAGYEQQDAHEFFIAMLDSLHLHFNVRGDSVECNCIIDGIFLGKLQSRVVCTVCGHQSITVDPFWDISLDLASNDPLEVLTLKECLNRYTRVEHLGESGMILCNFCGKNQQSTKQLQFKSLPFVLSLHLKRFEHRTSYKKIDNFVRFPEYLDLSEFTSEYDDSLNLTPGTELLQKNKFVDCGYSLYAVVNHVGSLDGGHYYAFIRHSRDEWYKCDDHWITRASREGVLSSPGYLLFYHKEVIQYRDEKILSNSESKSCLTSVHSTQKPKT